MLTGSAAFTYEAEAEEKTSETVIQKIFDELPVGKMFFDLLSGVKFYLNKSFEQLLQRMKKAASVLPQVFIC